MEHCHCMSMWALHMQLQLHFKSYPIQLPDPDIQWPCMALSALHHGPWHELGARLAPHCAAFYM